MAMKRGVAAPRGDRIHGAEAVIEDARYLGRPVLAKRRVPKAYRHPDLDARLRDERTRDEGNLLLAARRAGVPVPLVYDIARRDAVLLLEPIDGPALRDVLPEDDEATAAARLATLGRHVARLHNANIAHGDLTTSNVLVPDPDDPEGLVLIDFGLGVFTQEHEEKAVDLHLIEEALEATDARAQALMGAFLAAYQAAVRSPAETLRRLEAVRERGRYRGAA